MPPAIAVHFLPAHRHSLSLFAHPPFAAEQPARKLRYPQNRQGQEKAMRRQRANGFSVPGKIRPLALSAPQSYPQNKPSKGTKNISDSIIHFSLPFNLIFYCFFDSLLRLFNFVPVCEEWASVGNGARTFPSSRKASFSSSPWHLLNNAMLFLVNWSFKNIFSSKAWFNDWISRLCFSICCSNSFTSGTVVSTNMEPRPI